MSGPKICFFDHFVVANFTQQCHSSVCIQCTRYSTVCPGAFVLYGV